MNSVIYSPQSNFEDKNDALPVNYILKLCGSTDTNVEVVPGESGKKIRVVSLKAQSNHASTIGACNLLDGSGGTLLCLLYPPIYGAQKETYEPNPLGYFETTAGNGLYETTTTAGVILEIGYIIYTP